jgi:hypothetical protein
MLGAFIYILKYREIQPWYFLWITPLISLIRVNKFILSITMGLSFGLLLRYAPFLYLGNWDGVAVPVRFWVTVITPIVFVLVVTLSKFFPLNRD